MEVCHNQLCFLKNCCYTEHSHNESSGGQGGNLLPICFDRPATQLHCFNHITTDSHHKRHTHTHAQTASNALVNILSMCHWRTFVLGPDCRLGFGRPFVCSPCCRATSPHNGAIESEFALTHLAVSGVGIGGAGVGGHKHHWGSITVPVCYDRSVCVCVCDIQCYQ